MKHFCSVPTNLKVDNSGNAHYVHCGEMATHKVVDSDWYVCEGHLEYMRKNKWAVEKLEEA